MQSCAPPPPHPSPPGSFTPSAAFVRIRWTSLHQVFHPESSPVNLSQQQTPEAPPASHMLQLAKSKDNDELQSHDPPSLSRTSAKTCERTPDTFSFYKPPCTFCCWESSATISFVPVSLLPAAAEPHLNHNLSPTEPDPKVCCALIRLNVSKVTTVCVLLPTGLKKPLIGGHKDVLSAASLIC